MEAILDYYEINTNDIWAFEAYQYLINKRSDDQIDHLKNILEQQILKTRREQIQLSETITIEPFVTLADYDNNTKEEYWVRHVNEIREAKSLRDQVNLGYFNVLDNGLDSFFSLKEEITIDRKNDDFDLWFVLKLGQYKDGLKYLNEFLKYQFEESFQSNIEEYTTFLHILMKQYKNEFLNDDLIELTNEWISMNTVKIDDHETIEKKRTLSGQISTFYLKKVEEKPLFIDRGDGFHGLYNILKLLRDQLFVKKETEFKAFSKIFKGKALDPKEKIIWIGTLVELKWFVEMIIEKNICVEIIGVDKWIIAQNCFLYLKKGKSIEEIKNFKSISEARGKVTKRKENLNRIIGQLYNICNATPTD
jgi:hypothetical protein